MVLQLNCSTATGWRPVSGVDPCVLRLFLVAVVFERHAVLPHEARQLALQRGSERVVLGLHLNETAEVQ